MFAAFGNIVKIPELRKKALFTLLILFLCRVGVFVPLPGVNFEAVKALVDSQSGAVNQVVGLLNMFSGGALERASVFALGVMPYISASIIFQILTAIVPGLQRIAKDGETGRRKITQWTRWATIVLCLIQAVIICSGLTSAPVGSEPLVVDPGFWFIVRSSILLSAGTAVLMWLGEQIDEFGLGNGISLIIMIGIIAGLPSAIINIGRRFTPQLDAAGSSDIGPGQIFVLLALFVLMVVAVVFVSEATRRIPMQTPKRTQSGFRQQHFLPLKLNASGVMAIIFAQALMVLPMMLVQIPSPGISEFFSFFGDPGSFFYTTIMLLLIVFFSYFYTAIIFDPKEHAENFKQHGMFIPGIRPGIDTRNYLEQVMNRITFAGAIFIAIVAVVPQFIQTLLSVDYTVSGFFGGTGLLIVVGVALDLVSRIESHMLRERYDGFLKSGGRIRGRK